jgi:lysozyme
MTQLNSTKYPVHEGWTLGVDTSDNQGVVDFDALKTKAGVQFAIIKATEGTGYIDPLFFQNQHRADQALEVVGSYHFFNPKFDAVGQATHYAATTEKLVKMKPVVDFETIGGVAPADAVLRLQVFINKTIDLWGTPPIFYSYVYFIQMLYEAAPARMADIATHCDLWVAQYANITAPTVPKPWLAAAAWQFDGDGGLALPNGVDADFSWFRGTLGDLKARWLRGEQCK